MTYRLLYASSAVELLGSEELTDLLDACVRNNRRRNITGLLMYDGGNFIQALEGRREDVLEIFERIRADSRHSGVVVLTQGNVEGRCFEDWSMGFHRSQRGMDPNCDTVFALSEDAIRGRMLPETPSDVLIFMMGFYQMEKRRAVS